MIEFALVYMIGTVVVNQSQTFDNVNDSSKPVVSFAILKRF